MGMKIHNLSEFLNTLSNYHDQFSQTCRNGSFIFRGMSNVAWGLLPGIFREYSQRQESLTFAGSSYSGKIYSAHEYEILSHFRKEASGFLTHISQRDDFTWLQYAQHYGVPTRLLDFTANPLVAMYFCCQSESETDGVICIVNAITFEYWSTNETICLDMGPDYTRSAVINSIMREMFEGEDLSEAEGRPKAKKCRPVLFVPAYIDQRMSAQSSRFLLWGSTQSSLEDMLKTENEMALLPDGITYRIANDQRFLAKVVVPAKCKHGIMRELDLLNINEKSIFPGLDGIGKYINRYYQNNIDDICAYF